MNGDIMAREHSIFYCPLRVRQDNATSDQAERAFHTVFSLRWAHLKAISANQVLITWETAHMMFAVCLAEVAGWPTVLMWAQ